MEQLSLTTAETVPQIVTSFYRVALLALHWEERYIGIVLRGENGELRSFRYEGDEAEALMLALNKANLSTNSLQKRVLTRLVTDGKLDGTVTGTPD